MKNVDVPKGWVKTTMGNLGTYVNGRGFKKSEWRSAGRPIIRIQNLTGSSAHYNYFDGEVDNRHVVRNGDLLVSWAATLGSYFWRGPEAVLNQHIFRVESAIDARFHKHLIDHKLGEMYKASHGSGMVHITRGRFDALEVLLPPIHDQRRIVEILEDHLSRLDAGVAALDTAERRARVLVKSVLLDLIPDLEDYPSGWHRTTVGDAGVVGLGRQRHPDWHRGANMRPYLRVANVFEDRIDTTDIMEMHWPEETFERFKLYPGDILLNEGQSPEWLGRPAIYRGDPADVAFTNSILRFKAGDGVLPAFALLVFRRHMHAGRFAREARITTNIAHLSARRLKSVEFPIPPLDVQEQIVVHADEQLSAVERLRAEVRVSRTRSVSLRRALLSAAFSGRLTGASSDTERIEELVEASV